jgi:hypothetical protein
LATPTPQLHSTKNNTKNNLLYLEKTVIDCYHFGKYSISDYVFLLDNYSYICLINKCLNTEKYNVSSVIILKSKMLVAVTIVLIISIFLSFYGFAASSPKTAHRKPVITHYDSFTLTATGTARNSDCELVDVTLTIQGSTHGKIKTTFHLHTKGGDATIEDYAAISATKGKGIIVYKHHFIHLNVMMSAQYYGGRSTVWILRGTTGQLDDDTMSVSLCSRIIFLPLQGYPHLTHLRLRGTITLN